MKALNVKQGSAEWLYAKAGKIGGSSVAKAVSFRKDGKPTAERQRLLMEIVCERLTGRPTEHFVSGPMEHGTEYEPMARTAYEFKTGNEVDLIGCALHPTIEDALVSPDGLVGTDGLIEIKAPNTLTHITWLLAGEVPDEHRAQLAWGMVCCERQWADFISFDDRVPEPLQLFIKRMPRDDAYIAELEASVIQFLKEADELIVKLDGLTEGGLVRALQKSVAKELVDVKLTEELITAEDVEWAMNYKGGAQ